MASATGALEFDAPFQIIAGSPKHIHPAKPCNKQNGLRPRPMNGVTALEQAPLRRQMLGIFAIQLALVWALVAVWTYVPSVRDPLRTFFQDQELRVLAPFFAALVLLCVLYFVRIHSPWNWLVLLLFSIAQSVLFAGLGVTFDTNVGFYNCGAIFCQVLIMILLAGVRIKRHHQDDDVWNLLSPVIGAVVAYVVVAGVCSVLFVVYGQSLVTPEGFGLSLGFQFLLMLWLAFDTSYIYSVMYTTDMMQGAINLYTDMVALALTLVTMAALVAMCVASGGGGGGNDSGCGGVCCTGAGGGYGNGGFFGYYGYYGYYNCALCDCDHCGCEHRRTDLDESPHEEQEEIQRV